MLSLKPLIKAADQGHGGTDATTWKRYAQPEIAVIS
jgi:hypothetical protein